MKYQWWHHLASAALGRQTGNFALFHVVHSVLEKLDKPSDQWVFARLVGTGFIEAVEHGGPWLPAVRCWHHHLLENVAEDGFHVVDRVDAVLDEGGHDVVGERAAAPNRPDWTVKHFAELHPQHGVLSSADEVVQRLLEGVFVAAQDRLRHRPTPLLFQ